MEAQEGNKDAVVGVLNIGTEILTKDVMDQFLRSLGGIKTYYASKLSVAIETYVSKQISVVFCENEFTNGTIQSFLNQIGGIDPSDPKYIVLATKGASPELEALRKELNIHEILLKPFSTEDVHALIKRALQKVHGTPVDWELDLRVARDAEKNKRFQMADQQFHAMVKKYPNQPQALYELANYFMRAGRLDICEELVERAIMIDPNSARAISLMGSILKKKGNMVLGLQYLEEAQSISPLNSQRSYEIAECKILMAEEQLRKAITYDPYNSANHLLYIKLLTNRGQYAAAIKHVEAKSEFFNESDKREADVYVAISKKLGGIR